MSLEVKPVVLRGVTSYQFRDSGKLLATADPMNKAHADTMGVPNTYLWVRSNRGPMRVAPVADIEQAKAQVAKWFGL